MNVSTLPNMPPTNIVSPMPSNVFSSLLSFRFGDCEPSGTIIGKLMKIIEANVLYKISVVVMVGSPRLDIHAS